MVLQSYGKVLFFQDSIANAVLFYALMLFSLLVITCSKFSITELLIILIALSAYALFGNGFALKLILVSLACRAFDIRDVLKTYLVFAVIIFLLVIFADAAVDSSNVYYKADGAVKVIRYALGFDNPNKAFYYMVPIIVSFLFLYFKKIPVISLLLISISTYLVYEKTLTTTGLISNCFLIFMLSLYNFLPKISTILFNRAVIPLTIFLLFSVGSFYLAFVYHSDPALNAVLSLRPSYWYSISLDVNPLFIFLGQAYEVNNIPLDNSYIQSVLFMGVFFFYLMSYYYWVGLNVGKKNGMNLTLINILIIYVLIYSFGETLLIEPTLNLTFIIVFSFIRTNRKNESVNV